MLTKLITGVFLLFSIVACVPDRQKSYIIDNVEMRQLQNGSANENSVHVSYFMFIGNIEGQSEEVEYVKMFINIDGYYKFVKLPMNDVYIKINNSVDKPYLKVKYSWYDKLKLSRIIRDDYNNYYQKYIIICPEEYLPENMSPINL